MRVRNMIISRLVVDDPRVVNLMQKFPQGTFERYRGVGFGPELDRLEVDNQFYINTHHAYATYY